MPVSTVYPPSGDRILLFGTLAVQMDFISRDAFMAAINTWMQDQAKTPDQILLEQGKLRDDARALLEALVQKHLELHGNDPKRSLAALRSTESVREDFTQIADPELRAKLAYIWAGGAEGEDADTMRVRLGRWLRHHRVLVASATAALAVALIGLIIGRVASYERERTARLEAQQRVYVTDMAVAQRAWEANHVARVLELLEAHRPTPSADRDLRGWEWYYQDHLCHGELRPLESHTWGVSHVAFSPDGTRLISASDDMTVKLWDAASGQVLHTLSGHVARYLPGSIRLAISPDGTRLATTSWDQTVKLWDAANGQELRSLQGGGQCIAFSPDSRRLASGGVDEVKLWDVSSGALLHTFKEHVEPGAARFIYGTITTLAFHPDGTRLAAADGDELKVWDTASGQMLRTLTEAGGGPAKRRGSFGNFRRFAPRLRSVVFSPDGTRFATMSWDGIVKLWDLSGQVLWSLKRGAQTVAFSPDGTLLGIDGGEEVTLCDTASGRVLRTLSARVDGHVGRLIPRAVTTFAFSPDGTRLAAGEADGAVKLWDTATGQDSRLFKGHTGAVRSVAFSPDGTRLASGSEDKTVKLWDITSEPDLRVLGPPDGFAGWALSPDGRRLALAGRDGALKLWDVDSGQELCVFQGGARDDQTLAFSRDGGRLAAGALGGTVQIWDTANGKLLHTLQGKTGQVHSVAFNPNGTCIAAGVGYTVKVWDAVNGQELQTLRHVTDVNGIAFRPDGALLASASSDRMVRLWDVATGMKLLTLPGHTDLVSSVAFSPDGSLLASASLDHTVKLWDIARGQELRTLKGHLGRVSSVVFWPGGTRLRLATADENEVILWDAATGQEVHTLRGYTAQVFGVAFSQDGWRLASGCADGTILVWDATPSSSDVVEREAFSLLRFFFGRPVTKSQAMESLRRNKTITQPVREKALALVEIYWDSHVQQRASRFVHKLFTTPMIKPEVVASIGKDNTISDEVRRKALALAKDWQEDLGPIEEASWAVVSKPGADLAAYRRALTWAEYVCKSYPERSHFSSTLALAQYRVGHYQHALESLLWLVNEFQGSQPTDLAFLAMTFHQLGQKEQARQTLGRLREMVTKDPQWIRDDEALGFLREAEALIKDVSDKPK